MSIVNSAVADDTTVLRTLQASKAASAAGRSNESDQLLARAAQMAPGHPAVLNELGLRMMQRGDAPKARELFERATQADPGHPSLWSNLAASLNALGQPLPEMEAIEKALALEPRHLSALLQKGALIGSGGDSRNAARTFRNALATIPPGAAVPAAVSAMVARAREVVRLDDAALAAKIEARLASIRDEHGGGRFKRVERCIELLTGQRRRYHSEPTFMYFPEIPTVEFFDRADFPWLDAIEAATEAIRTELTTVLVADRSGLEPYIAFPEKGLPLDQWKELNQSRRWSAYFLWNQSVPNAEHLARCPLTTAVLAKAPQCDVPGRGPTAFFSILEPNTQIPPHTGVTNSRLTVHLPLIVPPNCTFRVGGETREWVAGRAWVFDDTIEHEAWNRSDAPRAILIFDIWNPFLSAAERDLIRAATDVVVTYYGSVAEGVA